MLDTLAWWFELAAGTLKEGGLRELIKRAPRFIGRRFYYTGILCEYPVAEEVLQLNEADSRPDIDDITLKVVSSNQEADELEAEGFEFRSCRTHDNRRLKSYRERLDHGAISFCVFVGGELAQITWVAPNQQALDFITRHRVNVDFSQNEVYATGSWTNAKYRGIGLYAYNILYNRDPFLLRSGVRKTRSVLGGWHPVGYVMADRFGSRPYAKLRFFRILWWKRWKETPI